MKNTISKSTTEKYRKLLTDINPVFGEMWKRGGFVFSDEYEVAALDIANGKFRVTFNPRYWRRITEHNRLFIICHEYLHVILGHWLSPVDPMTNHEWNNVAQDIQVNEMLVKSFGFVRENIKNWQEQCWLDVVFREKANKVKADESSEYYYSILMKCLRDS